MNEFEDLLERMVPGAARADLADPAAPVFPADLGLEPLALIGRGGSGFVFRARDPVLDREVAVKISRPDGGEAARKALLAEARLTARIRHPAVLPVHRIRAAEGLLCVEYALAPEGTLADRFGAARDGGEWPLAERITAVHALCGALAGAHALGVVHGDIHPANVVLGPSGEPYLLDWGAPSEAGAVTGHLGYVAPERLGGAPPSAAGDVYGLAAVLWELCTLRRLRPALRDEAPGAYVARHRDGAAPPLVGVEPALEALCAAALSVDPAGRPSAEGLRDGLAAVLSGHSERERERAEAEALLARGREALARMQGIERRLADELQVVAVQRTKVPGHAPIAQKRALWQSERRVADLRVERRDAWLDASEAASFAASRAPQGHALLAEVWWADLARAEAEEDRAGATIARRRVEAHDRGRFAEILSAPGWLTLTCAVPGAVAEIARFEEVDRVLVARPVEASPLPLIRKALAPGSWLVTVRAPGFAETRYPLWLDRAAQHTAEVRLFTPEQIGEGFVYVPAGPFRLGGDRRARQPLDPCVPYVEDRFFMRTCITSAEWLAFLQAIPEEEAARRVPGELGLFGSFSPSWARTGDGWALPPGWEPEWPVCSVSLADVEAYAAWRSAREGRELRLPTEEEWEKAARGVDGRAFPWGDEFDPTFCHMRRSRPGPPRPEGVGRYPVDQSVYGCFDMAGGMREMTSSYFDDGQRVIRGGTWGDDADDCRCACRAGMQPIFRSSFVSYRLVSEAPIR